MSSTGFDGGMDLPRSRVLIGCGVVVLGLELNGRDKADLAVKTAMIGPNRSGSSVTPGLGCRPRDARRHSTPGHRRAGPAQPAAADPPAAAQGAVLDTHTGPLADRGIVVAFDYDNKTGATRLGFALALKFLLWRGRFPRGHHELPDDAVEHVVRQVGVPAEKSQC